MKGSLLLKNENNLGQTKSIDIPKAKKYMMGSISWIPLQIRGILPLQILKRLR